MFLPSPKYSLALLFLIASATLQPLPALAHDEPQKRTISLVATGAVKTTPDKVDISTGVTSEAKSAREALDQNTEAMAKVVEALKGEGIEPKDIQTTNFSVSPVYEQRKEGTAPFIVGYRVTNAVRITVRDTKKLGAILDKVVSLGANQVDSIEFGVDDPEALKDEARKLALKNVTDKPVRYVVNTHFHFDHAHGNQVFPEGVEIIGHEFTRDKLMAGASKSGRSWDLFVSGLPARITEMEAELKAAQDASDQTKAEELKKNIEVQKHYQDATGAIDVTPPTTTLSQRMTLFRGGREIQLLYFGRGHTGGDVVVYLPLEKVVATGDLMTAGLSYMGDGYLEEWADTLEELKSLDFEVVLPGHGQAFREREKIDYFQAYLRDLSKKIAKMRADGVSAKDAAQQIDMTSHAAHFPTITGPGVHPHAVERAYALLEGAEQ